jgi:phenylpropionate dioxygenase-like ring-hydroxylating dioxygenase large terminal subunit
MTEPGSPTADLLTRLADNAQRPAQPIIVVRGADGIIRGLSNVCRHRMSRLVEGRGSARVFACPYHAWTYDLQGRLMGAPHMTRSEGFDKKTICLPSRPRIISGTPTGSC